MCKIEIKNRWSGKVVFSFESKENTIAETVNNANLSGTNLSGTDLRETDLRGTNLRGTNLRGTDLRGTDLSGANLRGTDLSGANLDFSCLPLWCGSLEMKTDKKLRIQIAYHLLSLIKFAENSDEEDKKIFEAVKDYANKIHRTDVHKL